MAVPASQRSVLACDLPSWLPIGCLPPPCHRKKNPPPPSEKKSLSRTSHPLAGVNRACAAGGTHHEIRPQKREHQLAREQEDRGFQVLARLDGTHDCYPRWLCDQMRSEQQERCRGRSNVVGSSALKRSIWNLQIFVWCKVLCTCEDKPDLHFFECNLLGLNGLVKELQSMEI